MKKIQVAGDYMKESTDTTGDLFMLDKLVWQGHINFLLSFHHICSGKCQEYTVIGQFI